MSFARLLVALGLALAFGGCGKSPCPDGARVEKEGGFCLVLPSAYKKATDNSQEGRMVYAYGPTGKMSLFVTPLGAEEYATAMKTLTQRVTVKPENPEIIEVAKGETSAFQVFRWAKQTSISAEYLVEFDAATSDKKAFRCLATTAREEEARAVLAACRTLRPLRLASEPHSGRVEKKTDAPGEGRPWSKRWIP